MIYEGIQGLLPNISLLQTSLEYHQFLSNPWKNSGTMKLLSHLQSYTQEIIQIQAPMLFN